jgi:hypothetical protein
MQMPWNHLPAQNVGGVNRPQNASQTAQVNVVRFQIGLALTECVVGVVLIRRATQVSEPMAVILM